MSLRAARSARRCVSAGSRRVYRLMFQITQSYIPRSKVESQSHLIRWPGHGVLADIALQTNLKLYTLAGQSLLCGRGRALAQLVSAHSWKNMAHTALHSASSLYSLCHACQCDPTKMQTGCNFLALKTKQKLSILYNCFTTLRVVFTHTSICLRCGLSAEMVQSQGKAYSGAIAIHTTGLSVGHLHLPDAAVPLSVSSHLTEHTHLLLHSCYLFHRTAADEQLAGMFLQCAQ